MTADEVLESKIQTVELAEKSTDASIQRGRDIIALAIWNVALAAPALLGLVANVNRVRSCSIFEPYTVTVLYQSAYGLLIGSVVAAFFVYVWVAFFIDAILGARSKGYEALAYIVGNKGNPNIDKTQVDRMTAQQRTAIKKMQDRRKFAKFAGVALTCQLVA